MDGTTWRELIAEAMKKHGETWADVVETALAAPEPYPCEEDELEQRDPSFDRRFHAGLGIAEGDYFTVWTARRVYFPLVYDGKESAGSAPRNPCDEACEHQGGS